jgi:glycosyltransferase involved in cell wall biosynthesis
MRGNTGTVKILHIIDHLGLGGAQNLLVDLVCHLDRDKYDPIVCAVRESGGTGAVQDLRGAGVKTICMGRQRWDVRKLPWLIQLIRRERPHIVHTHLTAASVLGRLSAAMCGTPVVIQHDHSGANHWKSSPFLFALFWPIDRALNRFTDHTIACSQWVSRFDKRVRGIPGDKLTVVHNYVDLQRFDPALYDASEPRRTLGPPEQTVVGTVGRLSKVKGIEYALKAAKLVVSEGWDIRLVVVGDGPLRAELESHADELGIRDRVLFTGYRQDVPLLMKAFDIFVLPSVSEPFGMVVAEAMAMGKPVVASDVGGVSEMVVDGRNGLLVAPGDSTALAEAMRQLLNDEELVNELGSNGRRTVEEQFDLDTMVRRTENVYSTLLAGGDLR